MFRLAKLPAIVGCVLGFALVASTAHAQQTIFSNVGTTSSGTFVYQDQDGYYDWQFDDEECDPDDPYNWDDPDCFYKRGLTRTATGQYVPAVVIRFPRFYFGVNAAAGWGTSNILFSDGATGGFGTSGGMAGVTIGADWMIQLANPVPFAGIFRRGVQDPWKDHALAERIARIPDLALVVGFEADVDVGRISGSPNENCELCKTSNTVLSTARGVVGITSSHLHGFTPYVTGGIAAGNVRVTVGGTNDSEWRFGYAVGGGVKKALSHGWSLNAEYLRVGFGDVPCQVACGAGGTTQFNENQLRLGLNHRF